ncbi:MAG: hypothetical protein ABSG83_01570 [Roseiarcus sp.]|jgi:hypothetical protein
MIYAANIRRGLVASGAVAVAAACIGLLAFLLTPAQSGDAARAPASFVRGGGSPPPDTPKPVAVEVVAI